MTRARKPGWVSELNDHPRMLEHEKRNISLQRIEATNHMKMKSLTFHTCECFRTFIIRLFVLDSSSLQLHLYVINVAVCQQWISSLKDYRFIDSCLESASNKLLKFVKRTIRQEDCWSKFVMLDILKTFFNRVSSLSNTNNCTL